MPATEAAKHTAERDELRRIMDDLAAGKPLPEGVLVHVDRRPTQADWDALDPNSYETTCAQCDAPIFGQFGPNGETDTPCPDCGSHETTGGIASPAGAMHLALWSDNLP